MLILVSLGSWGILVYVLSDTKHIFDRVPPMSSTMKQSFFPEEFCIFWCYNLNMLNKKKIICAIIINIDIELFTINESMYQLNWICYRFIYIESIISMN